MLSSSGANDSCVYATSVVARQLLGQTTNITCSLNSRSMKLRRVQYVWATFTNDPDRMGTCIYVLTWLQQTLLRSAMRGAETEFSIKLVHRGRGIADLALRVPRVSMLRARDGDNLLIQYGMLLSNRLPAH